MQLDVNMRQNMLKLLRDALMIGVGAQHQIIFYDKNDVGLCTIGFADIISIGTDALAAYKFKSSDGTFDLRGSASRPGKVTYFTIDGTVTGLPHNDMLIKGTAGKIRSGSDIEFNRTDWSSSTSIILTNLTLILNQGQ